jgi:hypothetical protein
VAEQTCSPDDGGLVCTDGAHILALSEKGADYLPAGESRRTSFDLRESHFGKRPNVFRIIFYIDGPSAHVIRVRRAQRRLLTRKEIDDASDEPRRS